MKAGLVVEHTFWIPKLVALESSRLASTGCPVVAGRGNNGFKKFRIKLCFLLNSSNVEEGL